MDKHGVAERYLELLPDDLRARARLMTAAEWLPLDEALTAYRACDELGLSIADQLDLGREVAIANNGVVISTIVRLLGQLASPWLAMQHFDRAWARSNRGGAIAVYKIGERSARLEYWQCPMARSPFFVTTMRGVVSAGLEPFCSRINVVELPARTTDDGFALRVSWT